MNCSRVLVYNTNELQWVNRLLSLSLSLLWMKTKVTFVHPRSDNKVKPNKQPAIQHSDLLDGMGVGLSDIAVRARAKLCLIVDIGLGVPLRLHELETKRTWPVEQHICTHVGYTCTHHAAWIL